MTNKTPVLRFDPQRRAADATLRTAIRNFIDFIEAEEQRLRVRSRARRDHDRRNFRLAAEALTCNLLLAAMVSPSTTVSVPRGHGSMWGKGRYRSPVFGQHFLNLLDLFSKLGFTEIVGKGYRFSESARQPTTIRPTRKLKARIALMA